MEYFASGRLARDLSRGKLFRHPIHAMLVHFPTALFPTSFLFDALGFFQTNVIYSVVAFYTLLVGIISGVLAGVFGALDYARLPHVHAAWTKASVHALLNIAWLIVLMVLFCHRLKIYPNITIAGLFELSVFCFCVVGMLYSNYLGGDLVLRHKLGTYDNS